MRLYEYAKKMGLSNKEVISILSEGGFEFASHMSALSADAVDFLEKKMKKNSSQEVPSVEKTVSPLKKESSSGPKLFEAPLAPSALSEPKKILRNPSLEPKPFVLRAMTVGDFSLYANKPAGEVILALLKQGIVCSKNQPISIEVVEKLAKQYDLPVVVKSEEVDKGVSQKDDGLAAVGSVERSPVVVVMGHVDHGKTTLLDFIRNTKVASREKGGITQHLGAYQVPTKHGSLVFLDTPGHEAFSNIRGRGLRVADIAILVVAADDSIKPQTIEAIQKAKAASVPMIVAINKIDRVDKARIDIVLRDLAKYDLVPEQWGGQTVCVPISAKIGTGIDQLLEMISLQAQVMELKTSYDGLAQGFILESRMEKGLGPVATVICKKGILNVGDLFAAGHTYGKVSVLVDSFGKRLLKVEPSIPVQVAGFSEMPQAGDFFEVVSEEKYRTIKLDKEQRGHSRSHQQFFDENSFPIIVKTDTTSSKEAILESIKKIFDKKDRKIHVIFAGIGAIKDSDVILAADTGAVIFGLHVKIEASALREAQKNLVTIKLHDIIYALLEDMEAQVKQTAPIKFVSKRIGQATISHVFDIKNLGVIAGGKVKEGRFVRDGKIVIWRGKEKIGTAPIKSLERDRKSVKEVHTGFEFALLADGFQDWQVDDRVECFVEVLE